MTLWEFTRYLDSVSPSQSNLVSEQHYRLFVLIGAIEYGYATPSKHLAIQLYERSVLPFCDILVGSAFPLCNTGTFQKLIRTSIESCVRQYTVYCLDLFCYALAFQLQYLAL